MSSQIFDRTALACFRSRAARKMATNRCDFLLQYVASDVIDRLSLIKRDFCLAFNYGCHGSQTSSLLKKLPQIQHLISSDSVAELVEETSGLRMIADEELFPFKAESLDLIVSLLNLQWVNDLPGSLVQIRQGLKPDGVFIAAMLGRDSLSELRHCLLQAEDEIYGGSSARVAPFADVRDLGHLLQRAGFALPVTDRDLLTVRYSSCRDLMNDLRAMGASNALQARSRQPVSRRYFERVEELYHAQFADEDGRLRASFEVIYLLGWAPHPDQQQPLKPGSAAVSLKDVFEKSD